MTIDGLSFAVEDTVAIYDIKKGEWKSVVVNGEKSQKPLLIPYTTATAFEKDGQMMGIIFGGLRNAHTLNL